MRPDIKEEDVKEIYNRCEEHRRLWNETEIIFNSNYAVGEVKIRLLSFLGTIFYFMVAKSKWVSWVSAGFSLFLRKKNQQHSSLIFSRVYKSYIFGEALTELGLFRMILKSFPKNLLLSPKKDRIFLKRKKIFLDNFLPKKSNIFPKMTVFFSKKNTIALLMDDFVIFGS